MSQGRDYLERVEMRRMSLSEIQETNVNTLFVFAEYCDCRGLRYWLAYGTLIGAVRHKGIIPWDDDIDVWMPRPDYERFSESFNADNEDTPYRFYYMGNDNCQYDYRGIVADERTAHSYERRVTDLQYGLHIDVFPLDYQSEDERVRIREARRTYRLVDLAHRLCLVDQKKHLATRSFSYGVVYRIAKACSKVLSLRKMLMRQDERARHHAKSSWVGIVGDPAIAGYRAEWFNQTIDLPFNGRMLHVPAGYDDILRTQYGDYMQLPPPEQRKPYGTGYWRDDE